MIAFITGSGFYELPGLLAVEVETPFGQADFFRGPMGGREILLLPRHGVGHRHLPNHINHQANLTAMKELGATAVVSLSVCGAVNPGLTLGQPALVDDVYFPENRLPSGESCTVFTESRAPGRGHLLASNLINAQLAQALRGVTDGFLGSEVQSGVYGHVNGPRFNTRPEVKALHNAGVDFISQTCGPEAVLANELELPFAMAVFLVDYANGVQDKPTPVEELQENLRASWHFFERIIHELNEPADGFAYENFVYRFE